MLRGANPKKVEKKTVTDKARRSVPARALPRSVQVSCQDTRKSGLPMQDTDERSPKETISTKQRSALNSVCDPTDVTAPTQSLRCDFSVKEHTPSTAALDEELKMKNSRKTPGSALTGGATLSPPPAETVSAHGEEEQTEEEEGEDEVIKAPVELIMEFLRAVMDRDFQPASKLCQMILIYEPDNPEASEFLPLIQKKLLEEQETEQSTEEEDKDDDDDDDDDDDADSGSDGESSHSSDSSSSSCSSSSSTSDDDENEKQVTRHKPCPPSHIAP
ncbi:glutamate-rich protein 2 [Plectropomus leopardus]|uniref:glutamate-rich protein 2 n=1 Tax=Plectropomus leopardus TaxID=160734 RepID=UPI001C4D835D|nr:glutamate-rich protein 2 [Plectropomus leopardus]